MIKKLLLSTAALAVMTTGTFAYAEMHGNHGDKKHSDKHMEKSEDKSMMGYAEETMDEAASTTEKMAEETVEAAEEMAEKMTGEEASKDIVETAMASGQFSTLVTAVKAADLVEALKGEGPLTVFAPTDEAFSELPEGTLEDLLKPENKEKLATILKYHVVAGEVMAGDIPKGQTPVATLQGADLSVEKTDTGVTVNDANVVKADIEASNGVVHVVDQVVLPQ